MTVVLFHLIAGLCDIVSVSKEFNIGQALTIQCSIASIRPTLLPSLGTTNYVSKLKLLRTPHGGIEEELATYDPSDPFGNTEVSCKLFSIAACTNTSIEIYHSYSGLPIERTGTDQNTWAKMHASTLIKHITENPSKIWRPVRLANMKKSDQTIFVAILE